MVKRLPTPMLQQHYNKMPLFTIILPSLLPFSYRLNETYKRFITERQDHNGSAFYFGKGRLFFFVMRYCINKNTKNAEEFNDVGKPKLSLAK